MVDQNVYTNRQTDTTLDTICKCCVVPSVGTMKSDTNIWGNKKVVPPGGHNVIIVLESKSCVC